MNAAFHRVIRPPVNFAARRAAVEAEIEMHLRRVDLLIARLGRIDGDCDIEDDDPCGDALEERGEFSDDDGRGMLPTLPLYGLDQSRGPINHLAATNAHLRSMQA